MDDARIGRDFVHGIPTARRHAEGNLYFLVLPVGDFLAGVNSPFATDRYPRVKGESAVLQLAYISTAKGGVDQPLLDAILSVSRLNNARQDVTGLLVSGGRRFLQVLEGPDQAVLATYARIQNDPRHRGFVLLGCDPVAERAFGQWSMAHRNGGIQVADDSLQQAVEALTAKIANPNLRAQFSGFAKLHGQAA